VISALADALEHACDLLERECGCEYAHGPECLAHGWRALVRRARGYTDGPISHWVDLTALAAREAERKEAAWWDQ